MADTVLSVRIDENLKQRFIELAQENDINNKDLMQMMVNHYELEQASEGKVQFSQDINELQRLTKRISDIYLNMVERIQLEELEQKNKENIIIEKIKKEKEGLQKQLEVAKEREKEQEVLKDMLKATEDKMKKILEEYQVLRDLNRLLHQKNEQLEKDATSMVNKLSEAEQALIERDKIKEVLEGKEGQIQKLTIKVELLQREKEQKQEEYEKKEIATLEKMSEQMNFLTKQHQIDLQELKLSLQMEHMERVEKLKGEHEQNIAELLKRNEQLYSKLEAIKKEDNN